MIERSDVETFLACRRIAVVGATDDPRNFGRAIVAALREHGHDAVAVNPRAASVAGAPGYAAIADVPDVDGVLVVVHRDRARAVVDDAIAHGVRHFWLFRGIGGAGAVSDDALAACQAAGATVVAGACPLMFLEPVGGAHKLHRTIRRMKHAVERAPHRRVDALR